MDLDPIVSRLLALREERSYEAIVATLGLTGPFHPAAVNNHWERPLAGGPEGWVERTTVFLEPPTAPTRGRVELSLIAPYAGIEGEKGWAPGTKAALEELSRSFAKALGIRGEKVGSTLLFERPGAPAIRVSRARLAATKLWHVVQAEVRILP